MGLENGPSFATLVGEPFVLLLDFLNAHHVCKLFLSGTSLVQERIVSYCITLRYCEPKNREVSPLAFGPSFLPLLSNLRALELVPFASNRPMLLITRDQISNPSQLANFALPMLPIRLKRLVFRGCDVWSQLAIDDTAESPSTTSLAILLPGLEELVLDYTCFSRTAKRSESARLSLPSSLRLLRLPGQLGLSLAVIKALPRTITDLKLGLSIKDPATVEMFKGPEPLFPPLLTSLSLPSSVKPFILERLPESVTKFTTHAAINPTRYKLSSSLLTLNCFLKISSIPALPSTLTDLRISVDYETFKSEQFMNLPSSLTRLSFSGYIVEHSLKPSEELLARLPSGLRQTNVFCFGIEQLGRVPRSLESLHLVGDYHGTEEENALLSQTPPNLTQIDSHMMIGDLSWLSILPITDRLRSLRLRQFIRNQASMGILDSAFARSGINKLEMEIYPSPDGEDPVPFALPGLRRGYLKHLRITLYEGCEILLDDSSLTDVHTVELISGALGSELPAIMAALPIGLHTLSVNNDEPDMLIDFDYAKLPPKLRVLELRKLYSITPAFLKALPRTLTALQSEEWGEDGITRGEAMLLAPPAMTDFGPLNYLPLDTYDH